MSMSSSDLNGSEPRRPAGAPSESPVARPARLALGSHDEDRIIDELTRRLVETYDECQGINHFDHLPLPSYEAVVSILNDLMELLFPGYGKRQSVKLAQASYFVGGLLGDLHPRIASQIRRAFRHDCRSPVEDQDFEVVSRDLAYRLLDQLPEIRRILKEDVQAAYDGDPAASGLDEIIFCYPGLKAIAIHRIAHVLHNAGVPLIPRMMTEHAHTLTGIDIHPGATIGPRFFIDHGTGVVIGETTVIGSNVKLYQGVTLGALSFPRDEATGKLIRGQKRHPTLENDVVIYANATILGGQTVIGHHSVIGSSCWITRSVAPHSTILIEPPPLRTKVRLDASGQLQPALDYQI
ncbi:serine O-acetyltransferase [Isosphaera pallida ATCC 43644]|uniref:Serine O-acetyltransferase n=1 Tax=Isosphaera pallida (strain ATCC 43644 / DSM 9630 / IS1B) TaxID=575540 RepID=E8QWM3_ISOPI|nr:serine O-acetyltransferase EpsC [Isosphaera pallida]ADV61915.1 serine O-acetyltransferase [Isosphaera pallida ATCC 43644]